MDFDYFNAKERASQKSFSQLRDRVFSPVLTVLTGLRISANAVTLASVLVLLAGVCLSHVYGWLYIPSLILYVLLDGIDGPLARHQGKSSGLGALNDITADQIGVPAVLAYLAFEKYVDGVYAAALSGLYIITIYNMVICNLNGLRFAPTARLKYVLFAVGAGCALRLAWFAPYANLFVAACSVYYLVMIFVNQLVAGRSRPDGEN